MYDWRTTLWRQGSIVEPTNAIALGLIRQDETESKIVIIASHDCDLTQAPDREPYIEFIVGTVIGQLDNNSTDAKTARKLHTTVKGQPPIYVELEAPKKTSIEKKHFEAINPSKQLFLSVDDLRTYQYWLGSRYHRSAFPDEFESRLKANKLDKDISGAVRPDGEHILAVLFNLDDGEDNARQGDDDLYNLEIYVLYASEYDEEASREAANRAVDKIQAAFKKKLFNPTESWKQIELQSCEANSDIEMTYYVFRRLKRWRLDYLSFASDPQQEMAHE